MKCQICFVAVIISSCLTLIDESLILERPKCFFLSFKKPINLCLKSNWINLFYIYAQRNFMKNKMLTYFQFTYFLVVLN